MAAKMMEVEVFVMVDSDGSYVAHEDIGELENAYVERINDDGTPATHGFRVVKVKLTVPLPVLIEVTGTIPADEEPSTLTVS